MDKPVHPSNALQPMDVTLPSDGMILFLHPEIKSLFAVLMMQFPALWYFLFPLATVILPNFVQPANIPLPISVTPLGIRIEDKPVHPANASLPIDVTLSGIVKEDNFTHPANAELPIVVTLFGNTILSIELQPLNPLIS